MQPETCPTYPYKQIVIAMGEGAKAAVVRLSTTASGESHNRLFSGNDFQFPYQISGFAVLLYHEQDVAHMTPMQRCIFGS